MIKTIASSTNNILKLKTRANYRVIFQISKTKVPQHCSTANIIT